MKTETIHVPGTFTCTYKAGIKFHSITIKECLLDPIILEHLETIIIITGLLELPILFTVTKYSY